MLNQQDREWVKAMVKEAATKVLGEAKSYAHHVTDEHAEKCPNVTRIKSMLIGVGIGAGLAGIGIGFGWSKVIALFL